MRTRTGTILLHEVWHVLDDIVPAGRTSSLASSGMVAAVSTHGSVVRALLRLPTTLRGRGHTGDILDEVTEALQTLPALSDVELHVKPSRPAWTVGQPAYCNAWDDPSALRTSTVHRGCAQQAESGLSRMGWVLDGEHTTNRGEHVLVFDKVCVIIHANIRPE
jgi:hypothetical protein